MSLIMPVFAVIIILFGLVRRVPVFDAFLTGAREGAQTLWRIAPTILGLIFAVGLLKSSGAVAVIDRVLAPAANAVGFPPEVVPMALLRPVSGSGSSALLMTVLQDCGPDSFAGRVAFGSIGVKKLRHTLLAAVAADVTAMLVSAATVHLFFG